MPDNFHEILIINYALVGSKHASNLPNDDYKLAYSNRMPDFKEEIEGTKPGSLSAIIQAFKSASTKLIHKKMKTNGNIWQRGFYDHTIRNESE